MTVAEHEYPYLLPQADVLTKPFWDALREHKLAIQECGACGKLRHPPIGVCPECGSEAIAWRVMNGRGTLYSYIVVHQTALPNWRGSVPYNIVMVALDEAPDIKLYGNVVDFDDAQLKVGLPVVASYDDVTSEDTILRWRVVDPT
ncbi:Zn-ribbon domain-containing OB-fold protein [Sphingobium indicum]|nr:OB-fold domain-containing protein [Sphingobium indicum]